MLTTRSLLVGDPESEIVKRSLGKIGIGSQHFSSAPLAESWPSLMEMNSYLSVPVTILWFLSVPVATVWVFVGKLVARATRNQSFTKVSRQLIG
ncbi:MAG: hypothetical protein JOZ45_12350 [Acidobacteriaceae bacterium]|nr:hypothetical protein [Acidobacteriaceae bacterium]